MKDKHTRMSTPDSPPWCEECSKAAGEYVTWPCNREKLVKTAVSTALYWERIDMGEELADAYAHGFADGKKGPKRASRASKGLRLLKNL